MPDHVPSTLATYWTQIGKLDQSHAESAWGWFIERYRGFVHDVLARHVGSARADAATSDFWSYLFVGDVLQRADRGRRLRGFLVGVLRNFARQWLRRQGTSLAPAGAADEPSVVDLPEEEEMALWAENVLHNALAEMQRRWPNSALVLRCFYGLRDASGQPERPLSVTETAARLQCNVNAVHQALHRGRQRLRHCVELELKNLVGSAEMAAEMPLVLAAIGRRSPGLSHE
ncbi:MAG: sigma-70 family RNA polymerase sigma factor [Planctomycetes bacterium]|nr:sigma-70 family RNA polymerase sigma factor [Planctomycetota bacterium]